MFSFSFGWLWICPRLQILGSVMGSELKQSGRLQLNWVGMITDKHIPCHTHFLSKLSHFVTFLTHNNYYIYRFRFANKISSLENFFSPTSLTRVYVLRSLLKISSHLTEIMCETVYCRILMVDNLWEQEFWFQLQNLTWEWPSLLCSTWAISLKMSICAWY